jgi:O-antigen ligase
MPLFNGGNIPLAWSIMCLSVAVLLFIWFRQLAKNSQLLAIKPKHIRFIWVPFSLFVLWAIIQTLPGISLSHPYWDITEAYLIEDSSKTISLDPRASVEGLMRIVSYAAVFWLALQYGRSEARARKALNILVAFGFIYALIGLLMYVTKENFVAIFGVRWLHPIHISSTFTSKNAYGMFAGIYCICSAVLFIDRIIKNIISKKTKKNLADKIEAHSLYLLKMMTFFVLIGATLLFSLSRGALGATLIALFFVLILLVFNVTFSKYRKPLFLLSVVIFLAIAHIANTSVSVGIERFTRVEGDTTMRMNIYKDTVSAISDNILLGTGLGTFEASFHGYENFSGKTVKPGTIVANAHNTYLENLLELGVFGFIFLYTALLGILAICIRGYFNRRKNQVFPICGIALSIQVGLHSLVDFGMEMPAIATTYFFIMGLCCAQSWSSKKDLST